MAKRTIFRALRVLAAVVALVVVVGAAAAARLSQGPIDLPYFKPDIEAALAGAIGADARIQRFQLDASQGRLALIAVGAAAYGQNGEALAAARRVNVSLDMAALMRGEAKPSRLEILGATAIATRGADGRLTLEVAGAGETTDAGGEGPSLDVAAMARRWLRGDLDNDDLPDIHFRDAVFIALDAATGETLWRGGGDAGGALSPGRALLWAAIKVQDRADEEPLRLSVTLAKGEGGDAAIKLASADLAALAKVGRLFGADLPPIDGWASGTARAAIDADLEPVSASADLTLTNVSVALPEGRRVALDHGRMSATADVAAGKITVTGVQLGENGHGLIGAAALAPIDPDNRAAGKRLTGRIDRARLDYFINVFGHETAPAAGLAANFSADFDIDLKDWAIAGAEAHIKANGRYTREDLFYDPLEFKQAGAFIAYDPEAGRVDVTGLQVSLDGIEIGGDAELALGPGGGAGPLSAKLRVGAFPVEQLALIWPKTFSPGGRAWVARNLSDGRVSGADITMEKAADGPLEVSGEFTADGLTVRYWDPMPRATNVAGIGRFKGDQLDIDVTQGAAAGMSTSDIAVRFTQLGQKDEFIAIDGAIAGPAPKLLAILDREPLRYAKWLGVQPEETSGMVAGRLKLAFPLIDKLSVDDLKIAATGRVRDALLPKAVNRWDLTAEDLRLKIDTESLQAEGEGALLDEPIRFAGRLAFGPGQERARFRGDWRLTRTVRSALGLGSQAIRQRLTGVTPAAFDAVALSGGRYEISVDANLTEATLLAQEVGWLKPKGVPARVAARVILEGEKPRRVENVKLTAPDLSLDADIDFDAAGEAVERVRVRRVLGMGHDLSADVMLNPAGEDRITISGARADLRPLLELNPDNAPPTQAAAARTPKPRSISIDIGSARLSEAFYLQNVRVALRPGVRLPAWLDATASYPGGTIRAATLPDRPGVVSASASDFGKLLAATGATEAAIGGSAGFAIEETSPEAYGVRLQAEGFEVLKSEIQRLGGSGATGILDVLDGGDSISFDTLDIAGTFAGGVLTLQDGRAQGNALGMTATGAIDLRGRTLDLSGAISPAYGISRAIGAIPLLGQILTGTKREGVFAAKYRASGSLDDPTFQVSAASALAPGILRDALPPPSSRQQAEAPEADPLSSDN